MNLRFGLAFVVACGLVTTADAQNADHFEQTLTATNNLKWSDCPTAGAYFFKRPANTQCLQTRVMPLSQNPAQTHYVYQLVRGIEDACQFHANKPNKCTISVLRVCSPAYVQTPTVPPTPLPSKISACKVPAGPKGCAVCMHAEEVVSP